MQPCLALAIYTETLTRVRGGTLMDEFFSRGTSGAFQLRTLLHGPEPVLAPGAYDALTARLIEQAGFPAVYMTGFGTSASPLARPTYFIEAPKNKKLPAIKEGLIKFGP